MKWTREHDNFLIREILKVDTFLIPTVHSQKATSFRDILNCIASPQFWVSQRSVRQRFTTLEKNFTKKIANEEKASGINLRQTL